MVAVEPAPAVWDAGLPDRRLKNPFRDQFADVDMQQLDLSLAIGRRGPAAIECSRRVLNTITPQGKLLHAVTGAFAESTRHDRPASQRRPREAKAKAVKLGRPMVHERDRGRDPGGPREGRQGQA